MSKRPRPSSSTPGAETTALPATEEIEKLRRYHAELGLFLTRVDSNATPFERVSLHVRKHFPLYALAAIIALIVVLVPTVNGNNNGTNNTASSLTDSGAGTGATTGTTGTTVGPAGKGTQAIGTVTSPGQNGSTFSGGSVVLPVHVGSGVTIGGYTCKPGVRQMPWSTYASPCVGKFVGPNGGKTFNGVDAKTIKIAIRKNAVDAGDATDAQNQAQGRATRAQAKVLLNKWTGYFEKVFDLYGRKIQYVDFNSKSSNGVQEAQSKGQDAACADATDISQSVHAFADLGYATSFIESQPFAECAKQHTIFVPFGASYFPESYFQRWNPYVWHVYMECQRIGHDVAEYVGKRLNGRAAKWALDATYKKQTRKFGVYVPDNDGYQQCLNITQSDLRTKYNMKTDDNSMPRKNYALDVSRFPDQAAQAVVTFHSAGVTTLINACDTLSTRFLTEAAQKQNWGPEWYIIGVATQDTDGAARTFNQSEVAGHLFGMSQLGQIRNIEGKDGEAYKTWKIAFPKETPPVGFGDAYYRVLMMFDLLQASGPILTPANIAAGAHLLPDGGGAHGAFGTWSFKGDHTAIDDSREIYYVGTAKGYDGNAGAYIETYGGQRFRSGQWPASEPPVYPK